MSGIKPPRLATETQELDTAWMTDAACAQRPGLPWIDNPIRVPPIAIEAMAAVCASCPVRPRCQRFVDEAEIAAGYWAGESRNGFMVQDFPRKARHSRGGAAA
jgi:hypothetical protein